MFDSLFFWREILLETEVTCFSMVCRPGLLWFCILICGGWCDDCVLCSDLDLVVPPAEGDPPASWWDEAMDLSLLVGVFKFGMSVF